MSDFWKDYEPEPSMTAPVQENTMIYKTFEQWKNGNVLEHGVPRTEYYSEDQLDLVEMGWNYGYDAGRAVEQALDKKAENARELGLDYETYAEELEQPVPRQAGMISITVPAPVAYLCENAVGHKYFRWKKPSSTFKPIALYTTPPAAAVLEGRDWSLLEATQESLREHMAEIKRLEHNEEVLMNALFKACGDDAQVVVETIESQGELK
jgi:hypothetical protein